MLSVAPLIAAVVLMTIVYTIARINEIDQTLDLRGKAIVHQMAPTTEYGLFSNNVAVLTSIVEAVRKEPDVVRTAVFNVDGEVIVESVSAEWAKVKGSDNSYAQFMQEVYATNIGIVNENDAASDLFSTGPVAEGPVKIGTVMVSLSKVETREKQLNTVVISSSIAILLILVTFLIARRIAAQITAPIERIRAAVSMIAHGKLEQRIKSESGGELGELERGINTMAESLQTAALEEGRRYKTLFEYSGDCVFLLRRGTIIDCNQRACQLFGVDESHLVGRRLASYLRNKDEVGEFIAVLDGVRTLDLNGSAYKDIEVEIEIDPSPRYHAEANIAEIMIDGERHFLVFLRDITERKIFQNRLEVQANYDAVTGLPNRVLAQDRLAQALRSAHRHQEGVALMFLDIDRFKNVNDTMGHAAGDRLLDAIGKRLRCLVRDEDTVSRFGGDEFLVIMSPTSNREHVEDIARKIVEKMSEPFLIDDRELFMGASIGVALYPEDGEDFHALLRNADTAMYRAKHEGRNAYRFFTREIGDQASYSLELEEHLRRSLKRNELDLHFQPQVDIETGAVIGAEVLLRWHSSHFGQVPLDRFIPVAEQTGLIVEIGNWVLARVCQIISEWRSRKLPVLPIAVNISSRQLQTPGFIDMVRDVMSRYEIGAGVIDFEITESLLLEASSMPENIFADLKSLGIRLSLDDFGVGYSSLSYLKRFPFDILKIDRSFVRDINHDPDDEALIGAIIAIGRALALDVVAEGVETEAQLHLLKQLGAKVVQGYLFSRPLPQWEFENYLKNRLVRMYL
ncbi:MAG: EAL domain-containing protein [Gammaproteobacteria bacterium]|nr:EAL domain-containing protein [Gammaproteobacteria bacterium]